MGKPSEEIKMFRFAGLCLTICFLGLLLFFDSCAHKSNLYWTEYHSIKKSQHIHDTLLEMEKEDTKQEQLRLQRVIIEGGRIARENSKEENHGIPRDDGS